MSSMFNWRPAGNRPQTPSATSEREPGEILIAAGSTNIANKILIDRKLNTSKTSDDSDIVRSSPANRPRRSATMNPSMAASTSRPADIRRTVTSLELNTHDLALAELRGRLRGLKVSNQNTFKKSVSTSNDDHDTTDDPNTNNGENVYDTFTGAHIGTFDQESLQDDMWTHLAKIRQLQSEIATMHLQMEGLGSGARPDKVAEDGEAENAEEAKTAKEQAFSQLENRFSGKRDAVNAIMVKVCPKI